MAVKESSASSDIYKPLRGLFQSREGRSLIDCERNHTQPRLTKSTSLHYREALHRSTITVISQKILILKAALSDKEKRKMRGFRFN
ncbi:hypothetical protein TNIN_471021 [Trichonephila inaurata madagascariensis]|uniref:Uncharacterized protein n=1 Tax=Trichonephila inaurata madagascariensis TaxID=2747483 RepID=A0A8X7CPF8_9ARAC|nr:hypothetical protein TNIN_471021 [Trichonephila inaurata madagascariensis]